jgi:DNA-binding transcriptional LysR family regulator
MQLDSLDGIATFITVVEEKTFSAAAIKLGVSPSAVSQSIQNLERRLALALFNRNTRGVSLTESGEAYFERVAPAIRELAQASEDIGAAADRPAGLLRINAARAGQMIILQPILRRFLDRYPEIRIELSIDNTLVDIVGRGFDAGIRFGDLVERDMVAIKVGPSISAWILASPDYLQRYERPRHPRDLLNHSCVAFRHRTSGQIERWSFSKDGESHEFAVRGQLIVNDSAALVQAAIDGIGIVYMINGYVEHLVAQGRLVRLLSDWSPALACFTLYYASRRRVPAKLRALIDFLRDEWTLAVPEASLLLQT